MSINGGEFSDGNPTPRDVNKGDPNPQNPFSMMVDKIRQGEASKFLPLEVDTSLAAMRQIDGSIPHSIYEKARSFLHTTLIKSMDHDKPIVERIAQINNTYTSEIDTEILSSLHHSKSINEQIMRLAALIFVAETGEEDPRPRDPAKDENEIVTALVRGTSHSPLTDSERKIISALATGMETGYGNQAGDKFERLIANIGSHVEDRIEIPEEEGDDFIEALLVTEL